MCVKELNEILAVFGADSKSERRNEAFVTAIDLIDPVTHNKMNENSARKQLNIKPETDIHIPLMEIRIDGVVTSSSAAKPTAVREKEKLEAHLAFFEKSAVEGHDISRMRECDNWLSHRAMSSTDEQEMKGWFEVKRTDSRFCSANCRVKWNQTVKKSVETLQVIMQFWENQEKGIVQSYRVDELRSKIESMWDWPLQFLQEEVGENPKLQEVIDAFISAKEKHDLLTKPQGRGRNDRP